MENAIAKTSMAIRNQVKICNSLVPKILYTQKELNEFGKNYNK